MKQYFPWCFFQGLCFHSPSWPLGCVCEPHCTTHKTTPLSRSTHNLSQHKQILPYMVLTRSWEEEPGPICGRAVGASVYSHQQPQPWLRDGAGLIGRDKKGEQRTEPRWPDSMAVAVSRQHWWIPKSRSAADKVSTYLRKLVTSSMIQRFLSFITQSPVLIALFRILFSLFWLPSECLWPTRSAHTFLKVSVNFSLISHDSARRQWLNE